MVCRRSPPATGGAAGDSAAAAVGVASPVAGVFTAPAGASEVTIRVTSTVTGVAATGVPHAASTKLASMNKLKRGNNNLRMILLLLLANSLENKWRTTLQIDACTSNLFGLKRQGLLFAKGDDEATLYENHKSESINSMITHKRRTMLRMFCPSVPHLYKT